MGLYLSPSPTSDLVAYTGADWCGCPDTRRSTSGYCVFLGDNLVSWSSKQQPTLSKSSVKAEYRGVANVVSESCWLRNLLLELRCPLSKSTLVYCDNVSAIYLAGNPIQHQRTKHIEMDIHFVRQKVARGEARVRHVPSRYQIADIFTEGLPQDYNEDGLLSFSEFSDLIDAFGNGVATHKKEELFKEADQNGDGVVSMDELAALLALQQEKEPLINSCPVCGEILDASNMLGSMIHMTLCFNEGTGNSVMNGGFLTENHASYHGWLFKLSEWTHFSSYGVGLHRGSKAAHILVFDRSTKRLVEELISGKIILSMRAIYQSKMGVHLMDKGAKEILQDISERQGKKMNSVDSAKEIPKFICFFKDQIKLSEVKYPLDHFKTFNDFFIRELKPGVRPIACMDHDGVAVCAADCRVMAFKTIKESTRFWIKGRKFSVQGLLGNDVCATPFIDGAMVIFRLAPQDYHRFHFPVSGTIERFVHIPGSLYTVNPIAVNSKYCNVFTENKRVISIISTAYFGKVAFVAIGATMVGSISFTRKEGDHVRKGDQFGYFSFGGSTVICVFEKDAIKIDADLLDNSARSLETLVRVGMQLGSSTKIYERN